MNKKKVIEVERPRSFTRADFDEDCNGVDIILIDARERSQNANDYASYLWGSSDPLLASIYKGNNGNEIYAVEIMGVKNNATHIDLLDYLRNTKYIPARVMVSDTGDSPESYCFEGGKHALMVRFSNHKDSNILYQTNENVFFGFDNAGVLSEFIYLGKAMTEKLLGKKITAVLEQYPSQAIKEKMKAVSGDK